MRNPIVIALAWWALCLLLLPWPLSYFFATIAGALTCWLLETPICRLMEPRDGKI